MTQLNNEDDIKYNMNISSHNCQLPHKSIPGLIEYGNNKLYPEERTNSTFCII